MELVTTAAFLGGVVAVVAPAAAAVVNVIRQWRHRGGDHLVLKVSGQEFVIDVSRIDLEDVSKIDDATEAVRESRIAA